jgi:hypothetical protein
MMPWHPPHRHLETEVTTFPIPPRRALARIAIGAIGVLAAAGLCAEAIRVPGQP